MLEVHPSMDADLRVFAVDDDPAVLKALERMLRSHNKTIRRDRQLSPRINLVVCTARAREE